MDHPGHQCPHPRQGHIPNVPRNKAHLCPRASMKAQHKTLPDGTGAGLGWIQAQAMNKSFYTMGAQGQQPWANLYQQNQAPKGRGRRNRGRNNRGGGGQQWQQGQPWQQGQQWQQGQA